MEPLLDVLFNQNDVKNNSRSQELKIHLPPQPIPLDSSKKSTQLRTYNNSQIPNEKTAVNKIEPLLLAIGTEEELNSEKDTVPSSFRCHWQDCNAVLSTRTGLATHVSEHLKIHFKSDSLNKNMKLVCKWNSCGEWFENVVMLAKHLSDESHIGQTPYIPREMNHSLDETSQKKRHLCSVCGRTYSSASNLKVHEKLHDPNRRRHVCTVTPCKKSYSTEADLKIHMRSHRGEFAYKCSFPGCTEVFVRASQLYAHERVHDNITMLKCGVCNKRFRMKSDLNVHEQTQHQDLLKEGAESSKSNSASQPQKLDDATLPSRILIQSSLSHESLSSSPSPPSSSQSSGESLNFPPLNLSLSSNGLPRASIEPFKCKENIL
uniref:Predicted protein n=1 Tax=Hordeum vulgare subsp. vulgare TaxID=112509 RepID=F2E726_HORVV|nr:predicted protein [Hordeum vulgare subsp. vulgare]